MIIALYLFEVQGNKKPTDLEAGGLELWRGSLAATTAA
jgi:hypothetical protein